MNRDKLNKIMDLADDVLMPHGFECIEAEWLGKEETLRLYIDREGGVDISACVEATRLFEGWQGLSGREPGSYGLEVSSPGLERPLRRLKHFERYLGSEIKVALIGRKGKVGLLKRVSHEGVISVLLDSAEAGPEEAWDVPVASIKRAHLLHKWDE